MKTVTGIDNVHSVPWAKIRQTSAPIGDVGGDCARSTAEPDTDVCSVDGCDRRGRLVRGWCRPHYKRWVAYGDPAAGGLMRPRQSRGCDVDGCDSPHYGFGFCSVHYGRFRRHGDPHTVLPKKGPPPAPPLPECRIDGCVKTSKLRGQQLCGMHDMRLRRHGDPLWEPQRLSRTERFWRFVDTSAGLDGCWPWTGAILRGGYGQFYNLKPHRVAYELLVGPIPVGLTLDHLCHTQDLTCPAGNACLHRRCVNPRHLEPVTQAENNRRGAERARRAAALATEQAA